MKHMDVFIRKRMITVAMGVMVMVTVIVMHLLQRNMF